MRQLEQRMVEAIGSHSKWAEGNTMLIWDYDKNNHMKDTYAIWLHGHCIAKGKYPYAPHSFNLCGYPTDTTLNRLRALGIPICLHKSVPCLVEYRKEFCKQPSLSQDSNGIVKIKPIYTRLQPKGWVKLGKNRGF